MRQIMVLSLGLAISASLSAQQAFPTPDMLAPGVPHELAQARVAHVRDVRYLLMLDVTGTETANGHVTIRFTAPVRRDVVLDFRGREVVSILANGMNVPVDRPAIWNGSHIHLRQALLRQGANEIEIGFTTPIAAAGASIIRSRDNTDGSDYLYTLLVPSDANLLFPCFDQPDIKARVTMSIRAPNAWTVLANGASAGIDRGDGSTTHRFAATQPISTYLIAFAAGPYTTVDRQVAIVNGGARVPMRMLVRASRAREAETDSLVSMNAVALRWLGDWFRVPYPFGKYDFVLAPAFPFGGMEHPGAVFYNEQSFIYRERPTASQLLGRQATIFHEVAHQWFGDYFTMRWFDDLWLKEGFATYMAAKMQAELNPASEPWKTFYLRNKPVAYGTDATSGTTPVWQGLANLDQAKSNYGAIVYNKAPGVLRQLNHLVGDRAFQQGLQVLLKNTAYGNAGWRALVRAVGQEANRDLTGWAQQWILRPGMPIIEQSMTSANGRISALRLHQRPAQPSVSGSGAWPQKLSVLLYYANAEPVRLPVEFTDTAMTIPAARGRPVPDFVFANDGDYGYAIVLPDSASVRWLEARIGTVQDDLLRAMLWGAMWDLVREARLSPARFAAMALRELPAERDEQIAGALTGRLATAVARYGSNAVRDSLMPVLERTLLAGALDTARTYGQRKSQLDALISVAQSPSMLARLDAWLDADSAAGLPLRPPTRWSIVTKLVSTAAPTAAVRLAAESRRDSTSEGQRQAFVAGAAVPDSATKRAYFTRWFADSTLNEEWVTSSLRAFHDTDHEALTVAFLTPALDTLPWIQRNRRIFFLGSWLGASIGGQTTPYALRQVDAWLSAHPTLAPDLRRKVLQARDELERTVRIRAAFGRVPAS